MRRFVSQTSVRQANVIWASAARNRGASALRQRKATDREGAVSLLAATGRKEVTHRQKEASASRRWWDTGLPRRPESFGSTADEGDPPNSEGPKGFGSSATKSSRLGRTNRLRPAGHEESRAKGLETPRRLGAGPPSLDIHRVDREARELPPFASANGGTASWTMASVVVRHGAEPKYGCAPAFGSGRNRSRPSGRDSC